jgi:TetR/AcrR family transcriptional regulator
VGRAVGKAERGAAVQKKSSGGAPSAPRRRRQAPPAERRQYLPADERRQRILDSSRKVFARTGLQGARTRDLALAAGINPATLFAHFASKEDLFAAAVLQPLSAQFTGIRERYQRYETADSAEDLLDRLQSGTQKHLETMVEIYPLLMQALADHELGRKLYKEQIVPMIGERTALIRGLIKDTLDPELVELASFGMFLAVAMNRILTGQDADLVDVSRQLIELLIFGCARQPWDEAVPGKKTPRKRAVAKPAVVKPAKTKPAKAKPAKATPAARRKR